MMQVVVVVMVRKNQNHSAHLTKIEEWTLMQVLFESVATPAFLICADLCHKSH